MLDDMKPSFTPPKKIDDPEDTKPSDWIDEKYTDDPEEYFFKNNFFILAY